jgi:hypothetical protein
MMRIVSCVLLYNRNINRAVRGIARRDGPNIDFERRGRHYSSFQVGNTIESGEERE